MRYTYIILILTTALFWSSCTSTRSVSMDVTRPADINVPKDIQRLLIIDRSKFKKGFWNLAEGVLTGELPNEDKNMARQSLGSLHAQLIQSQRFEVVTAEERLDGNNVGSAFPPRLTATQVKAYCAKYKADGLIALELFDTDFIVTSGKRNVKKTEGSGKDKKEVQVTEYYVEGVGSLKMGLRLYDGTTTAIIDEHYFNEGNTWSEAADSRRSAIIKLIDKSEANNYLAQRISSDYAFRISPQPIRISRSYYYKSKKSPAIERGARYAQVNQWEKAAEVWRSGIENAPEKQAGFLAFNIALANEVLGDLELARQWAQEAYAKFGNKKARDYVGTLDRRKRDQQKAEQQLK